MQQPPYTAEAILYIISTDCLMSEITSIAGLFYPYDIVFRDGKPTDTTFRNNYMIMMT